MKATFRALASLVAALWVLLVTGIAPPVGVFAQTDPATDVYNRVNAIRAEVGLPPYRLDPILSAAAQAHSEWGASVGYFSHDGANGSRPTDRAVAAGYGDYGAIRISENIYWGGSATPASAVAWWRNSSIHYAGMTSTNYTDIGVGVAYSGSGGYFTLLFGTHLSEPSGAPPAGSSGSGQPSPPAADIPEIPQVELATPSADGSIIHTVNEGEAIWNIAAAYGVDVPTLLAQNNLTEGAFIHVGDPILVRPASTPVPTITPTVTLTATLPPRTPLPSFTPAAVAEAQIGGVEEAPVGAGKRIAAYLPGEAQRRLQTALIGTLLLGVGMAAIGFAGLRRATPGKPRGDEAD
jgi:uncharacterized protein YkwD/LysM repeat protein